MVRVKGVEPPRLAAPDPKSGASANSATPALLKKWCRPEDLNPQPTDYKSVALPIELGRHIMVEDDGLEPPTLCL